MWTREEAERWWPETHVLVDSYLERGTCRVVSDSEAAWTLKDAENWCAPHFHDYPLPVATFVDWSGPLTRAHLEKAARALRYPNCLLRECEEWDGLQSKFPRALGPGEVAWTMEFYGMPVRVDPGLGDDEAYIVIQDEPTRYGVATRRWLQREVRRFERQEARPTKSDPSPKSKVPLFLRERSKRMDGRR